MLNRTNFDAFENYQAAFGKANMVSVVFMEGSIINKKVVFTLSPSSWPCLSRLSSCVVSRVFVCMSMYEWQLYDEP